MNKQAETLRTSALRGNAFAALLLAQRYDDGRGVRFSPQTAERWYRQAARLWRKAAKKGDAIAQYRLGVLHLNGLGVRPSRAVAVRLLRRSADQGNAGAQFYLGMCYSGGLGVKQSFRKAAKRYRIAANGGDPGAADNLAALYRYGCGVPLQRSMARRWRRRATQLRKNFKNRET